VSEALNNEIRIIFLEHRIEQFDLAVNF